MHSKHRFPLNKLYVQSGSQIRHKETVIGVRTWAHFLKFQRLTHRDETTWGLGTIGDRCVRLSGHWLKRSRAYAQLPSDEMG